MGFFNSIFGKKAEPTRELTHPSQLNIGDMISLDDSFALPAQLRGQQLRVEAVHTYEYERSQQSEWQLKGFGAETIYLSIEQDDETHLAFSLKISRRDVEALFDLDAFGQLFEEPGKAELTVQEIPAELSSRLEQWLGKQYHQVSFADFGYFHREDYRGQKPPQDADGATGEPFECYQLLDEDESRAVDVEVYEGGDTDVVLTIYRPLSDIREYWPGK